MVGWLPALSAWTLAAAQTAVFTSRHGLAGCLTLTPRSFPDETRIGTMVWRALLLGSLFALAVLGQSSSPVLWYWQNAYPESLADVSAIEAQIDQAATYGYTGVAFWSSAFTFMGSSASSRE